MNVLLTNEEIQKAVQEYGVTRNICYEDAYYITNVREFEEVAKAQYKKVMEDIYENIELCSCDVDEDGLTYRIPFKYWQSLLDDGYHKDKPIDPAQDKP